MSYEPHEQIDPEFAQLYDEIDRLTAENTNLRAKVNDVEILMDESQGVYGLHLNGDNAKWSSLLPGGRYEEWLIHWVEVEK